VKTPPRRVLFSLLSSAAVLSTRASAHADDVFEPGAGTVASVFFIAKSQNKNQVHYGVHLDQACRPLGPHSVYAYWRMNESKGEREPLLPRELPAYGLADEQRVETTTVDGTQIRLRLRSIPERPLILTIGRASGRCEVRATTTIAGSEAQLHSIYLRLKWPFGVDYILLQGNRAADNRWIEEKVQP
jgi:hypothetical protein